MNQFFYNMATTAWVLKHVLLLTDHNQFSRCTVKEHKGLYYRINTTQSVKQQLNDKTLNRSLKPVFELSLLNNNENVAKQCTNTQ